MFTRMVDFCTGRVGRTLALVPLCVGCGEASQSLADRSPRRLADQAVSASRSLPVRQTETIADRHVAPAWAEGAPLFDPPPTGLEKKRPAHATLPKKSTQPTPQKQKTTRRSVAKPAARKPAKAPAFRNESASVQESPEPSDDRSVRFVAPHELPAQEARPLESAPAKTGDAGAKRSRPTADAMPPRTARVPTAAARQSSPPVAAAPRSPQLAAVDRRAAEHVLRGYRLASRGATFSARAEFIQALRVWSQALDVLHETSAHSQALAAGLAALEEVDDFVPRGSRLEAEVDVLAVAGGHRTPVLQGDDAEVVPPLVAVQRYLTYAQEQLGAAAANEQAASMALFGLGKLACTVGAEATNQGAESKGMAYYQAALDVHPGNYQAANELAVLLAKAGHLERACSLLRQSVAFSPQPAAWRNLAAVHNELGEAELARQAVGEARRAEALSGEQASAEIARPVRWVNARSFASYAQPLDGTQSVNAADTPANEPAARTAPRAGAAEAAPAKGPEESPTAPTKSRWLNWFRD